MSKSKTLRPSFYQLMAEKLLGKEKAHEKHAALYRGEVVPLVIEGEKSKIGWAPYVMRNMAYLQPAAGYTREAYIRGYWSHIWTSYRPLNHVEIRNPYDWPRTPTYKEFLWMALAFLSIEHPLDLQGGEVRRYQCISLWSHEEVEAKKSPLGWLGDPDEE